MTKILYVDLKTLRPSKSAGSGQMGAATAPGSKLGAVETSGPASSSLGGRMAAGVHPLPGAGGNPFGGAV